MKEVSDKRHARAPLALWVTAVEWLRARFELSRGGAGQNIRPMEGLRGFAVFLVFLVHYSNLIRPWLLPESSLLEFAKALRLVGSSGVDLFFVLSGYVIYGSLISRAQPLGRFVLRRVRRIYPAFIVVLSGYVVLSLLAGRESKIPDGAGAGVVYIVSNVLLLPGLFPIEPLVAVAWSLSYEMFYYFTIPLVITVFGLRDRERGFRIGFFLALAAVITGYGAAYGGHLRLVMFIAGIVVWEAVKCSKLPGPGSGVGLLALAVGLVSVLLPFHGTGGYAFKVGLMFWSFGILCYVCFRNADSWLARVFSRTPLRWLGNMSYSYYLLHNLVLHVGFLGLGTLAPAGRYEGWFFWAVLPVMFAVTLFPTGLLFLAVERPLSLAPGSSRERG